MRLLLAQKQLAEEIPDKGSLGLLSDETSKSGVKLDGFHVSDEQGRLYVLGLRDITSKSAKDVLRTFKTILSDIQDASEDEERVAAKENCPQDYLYHV